MKNTSERQSGSHQTAYLHRNAGSEQVSRGASLPCSSAETGRKVHQTCSRCRNEKRAFNGPGQVAVRAQRSSAEGVRKSKQRQLAPCPLVTASQGTSCANGGLPDRISMTRSLIAGSFATRSRRRTRSARVAQNSSVTTLPHQPLIERIPRQRLAAVLGDQHLILQLDRESPTLG